MLADVLKKAVNLLVVEHAFLNFNGRITNYRLLAAIYNTFLSESATTVSFNPEQTTSSKHTILEHITNKKKIEIQLDNYLF